MVARAAFSMALESHHVHADVIEVQEFPQLAQMYNVRGVPKTVINESVEFAGMVPEETFIQHVLEAAGIHDSVSDDPTDEQGESPLSNN